MRVAGSNLPSGGGVRPYGRVGIVTCIWIVCALGTLAVSHQQDTFYTQGRYGKRKESYGQPAAFFSGSRYGRGGATNSRGPKSDSKLLEVSPRVDRFFLGSRYGKRALAIGEENPEGDTRQRDSPAARISSLKRYEEAIGYFDRSERPDRAARTIDRRRDDRQNRSGESIERDNPGDDDEKNDEDMPMIISKGQDKLDEDMPMIVSKGQDELDNFW